MSTEKTHEGIWNDFWAPLVTNDDGTLNLDQIKRELADWHYAMGEVSEVYLHVTGDALSKPLYFASDVIAAAEEHTSQRIAWAINDFIDDNDLPDSLKVSEDAS